MEKSIIQRLIDEGVCTHKDVEQYMDEYNKNKKQNRLIQQQVEETSKARDNQVEKCTYSKIENGILKKFDERDLVFGIYKVPENVHDIASEAFKDCQCLEQIYLPNVQIIWSNAFAYCTNLRKVKFGKRLRLIDKYAFWRCENLEPINLDVKSTKIHWTAFMHCPNWEYVSNILLEKGKAGEEIEWYHK